MSKYLLAQVKQYLPVLFSLLMLPFSAHSAPSSESSLVNHLETILIDAEAVNTQLAMLLHADDKLCAELFKTHKIIHHLHSKIDKLNKGINSSSTADAEAIKVLEGLSSKFVAIATRTSDLSLNSEAIKCSGEVLEYNEGMSTMLAYGKAMNSILGLANDISSMANHVLEMSDKILLKSADTEEKIIAMVHSQKVQSDNLNLTHALTLVAQRNSLASVTSLNSSPYNKSLYEEIFSGHVLSSEAAATFLTRFNIAREWEHLAKEVEGLVAGVNLSYEKIALKKSNRALTVDAGSYIAMAELSSTLQLVALAVDKMAVTTERLSFTTSDDILRDSIGSMLEVSTQLVHMTEQLQKMVTIILARGSDTGLTKDQLMAAQQLQTVNYKSTLALLDATQARVMNIVKVNSL